MKSSVNCLDEISLDAQIPIVPYVDVFMVLSLILLASVSPLYQHSSVQLPRTGLQAPLTEQQEYLIVSLTQEGSYGLQNNYTNDNQLPAQILYARLKAFHHQKPDIKIVLQADYRCSYDDVAHLLSLIHRSGFEQVALVAEPESQT